MNLELLFFKRYHLVQCIEVLETNKLLLNRILIINSRLFGNSPKALHVEINAVDSRLIQYKSDLSRIETQINEL